MGSVHWGYFLPAGLALILAVYLSATIGTSRPENASTLRMRLMLFSYGFTCLYLGGLAWHFDLSLSRYGYSNGDSRLGSVVFLVIGTVFTVTAALRSRAGLIKDSELLEKPLDEDISGEPEITPEERVRKFLHKPDGGSRDDRLS